MPVGGMKPWDTISKNCAGNFFATKKQLPVFPLEMRCFTGGNLQSDEQGTCDRQLLDVGHHKSDGVCGDPLLSAEARQIMSGRMPDICVELFACVFAKVYHSPVFAGRAF